MRAVGPRSEEERAAAPSRGRANPGYAAAQLARALFTSQQHADAATRARAAAKVERWTWVFDWMLGGGLDVGSRAPVAGLPPWVTLEVVKGGFTTGNALVGRPLAPLEVALCAALGIPEEGRARAAINVHYLGDAGQAALLKMLRTGRYRIQVPEEGALPVLAWLAAHGKTEEAHALRGPSPRRQRGIVHRPRRRGSALPRLGHGQALAHGVRPAGWVPSVVTSGEVAPSP